MHVGMLKWERPLEFDKTARNTGCRKGNVSFENIVGRELLWLACMYHTTELQIKHANEILRSTFKGLDDAMFELKLALNSLEFKDFNPTWPGGEG